MHDWITREVDKSDKLCATWVKGATERKGSAARGASNDGQSRSWSHRCVNESEGFYCAEVVWGSQEERKITWIIEGSDPMRTELFVPLA